MPQRTGQVTDEYNRPVPGAMVYVYDNALGTEAALTSDGTTPLSQPLQSDEFGFYSYFALDNYYREDTYFGGKLRWKEIVVLGTGGSPGGDLTLRSDLAVTNNSAKGAGLTGFSASQAYAAGTVGDTLRTNPSGTGAVRRSIQVKSLERIHAGDYGVIGDNSTDNTAALANLLKSGREVYFPAGGTYKTGPATFTGINGLKITGPGRDVSKIVLTSTGTGLKFSNCQWLQLSDITIEASGAPQSLANAIGIQLDEGSCNAVLERFILRGFSLDGIRQVGTLASPLSGNTLRDGYVLGCGRNQLYGYYNNDFTVDNVQTGSLVGVTHGLFGMLLENCSEGGIINTKTWEHQVGYKALNCSGIRHSAVRVELSDHENLWIEDGSDLTFDGSCRIFSASQSGNGLYDNIYLKNHARPIILGDVMTWDATYSKWAINLDTGCDDATLKCHQISGYDPTNAGPIRVVSGLQRISSDITNQLNGAAVAAASTVYLSGNGSSAAEGAGGRQCHTQLAPLSLIVAAFPAPGVGKNFTYTLRKNGVDTGVTVQISGTGLFARINTVAPAVTFDVGDWYSLKLVTDSGAAVSDHRATLVMAEI